MAGDDSTSDDAGTTPETGPRTGNSGRRPTKAASAASRARRIGGAGRSTTSGRAGDASRSGASAAETGASDAADTPETEETETDAAKTEAVDADTPETREPGAEAKDETAAGSRASTPSESVTLAKGDTLAKSDKPADADTVDTKTPPARSVSTGTGVVVRVPSWLKWAPALVLGLGAVAMIVLVLIAAHSVWYARPSTAAVRDRVLAAAKTCTAQSNTYSYTTLAKDEASGAACTTGKYTQQFKKAFDRLVKPQAVKLKASQSVQINAAGIETVRRHQWTVVVYGQTKITQSGAKARIDPFAAEVVMQQAHGEWLIENIKLPTASG